MPELDFWYEFASTYSYLAAMRAEALAGPAGVRLRWRPFLLGPIFAAQGWTSSPFNLYPAKGRYMWRDMERVCALRGQPLRQPDPFPQNSLLAARLALAVPEESRAALSRAVFHVEFGEGRNIADEQVLRDSLAALDLPADAVFARAKSEGVKAVLRENTEAAQRAGIFGAPAFVARDGELFWGDDRFEQALDWARDKG
ncbi:2-hydroxychromene-2-carboxylate isomerase [Rhodoblastus sp. 17X3]|uniref:2-hydroxychromene-2-carboxylate isomerase n=1 Tax=Rhodoblastus sp. 17X3 TaxID=3047026 RepID=UPI0024B7E92F|nr:2-hydroxychromene-2-carboxylate isomerase [Rhodoblastus sp. 17X3]MDI9849324.1 2-hydroxychromene-2-carboxylate isomerase [Rhodoblastus sp. 17X3]